ncbi:hypothetical protein [Streptomyces sp. YKOK-I1]
MPAENEENAEEGPDPLDTDPLPLWGRVTAGVVGLPMVGAGAVAVFLSDNQAGSAVLIIAGVILVFMLISGNPLYSLGHGETQVQFARARRRQVLVDARDAPTEEAQRVVDTLTTVDPAAERDPAVREFSRELYERRVHEAILRCVDAGVTITQSSYDYGHDYLIHMPVDRVIAVAVLGHQRQDAAIPLTRVQEFVGRAASSAAPLLVVSNARLGPHGARAAAEARDNGVLISVVRWRDEEDDDRLRTAIVSLASRISAD